MKKTALILFLWILPLWAKDPEIFYLTWDQDPATTMVVEWHGNKELPALLYFQKEGDTAWYSLEGNAKPFHAAQIFINTVKLSNLEPDTRYFIQFAKKGVRYNFRTLPKEPSREIRFVVGGDIFYEFNTFKKMNQQIAKVNPDFIVLGGDLAYAQGMKTFFKTQRSVTKRWATFFRLLKQVTVTADKRLIPILPIVGNHDVTSKETKGKGRAFFYEYFPHLQHSYSTLKINDNLCLFLLDTGHLEPVEGKQTEWLDQTLTEHSGCRYKIPLYHVAAYPSYYSYHNQRAQNIRKNWVPLFEKHQVKFAFENHNHTYKKTFPIKEDKIDPTGIMYLGDGAWGVPPRQTRFYWYLEQALQTNCFWLVTYDHQDCHLNAFDLKGRSIDAFTIK